MLTRSGVFVVIAALTLITPILFVGTLAIAGVLRSRGRPVGPRLVALVTALGGSSLGLMALVAGVTVVAVPIAVAFAVIIGLLLGRGRPREAGWFLAGGAAPWTGLWAVYLAAMYLRLNSFDFWSTWIGFLVSAAPMFFGLALAVARRVPGDVAARRPAKRPPGRSLGEVGRAIMSPAIVGPFGLPEVGLLVALVATWFGVGLLLPASLPEPIRLGILIVVGAALGAEAWIRAFPTPARQAFEAFSWLGDWEIARVRSETGSGVPTTLGGARNWLLAHPDLPDQRWIRVEILLLAGRFDEARAVAQRMPDVTAPQRLDRATSMDLADWFAGGDGQLEVVEQAARELDPADEDARLRAEVAIAIAKVRRRLAAGDDPIEASAPLRDVRPRLGRRADGQVGRAMRWRLQRTLLIVGVVFALGTLLLDTLLPAV